MKAGVIDDAFFRGKALLVEDALTQIVLSECWRLDQRSRQIEVRPVGGHDGVQRLVQASREQGRRHVFGLIDRDFGTAARAGASVMKTERHEFGNHLLDYAPLAKISLGTSAAAIEQAATARAAGLQAWMAVRRTLVEMKVEIPGMPRDPGESDVPDEAAAKAWVHALAYPQDAERLIRTKWTKPYLDSRLPSHHGWCADEISSGRWVESFSGKEIFEKIRSEVDWRYPITSNEDLAFKVAEHWQLNGSTPAFINDLRDAILAGSGL